MSRSLRASGRTQKAHPNDHPRPGRNESRGLAPELPLRLSLGAALGAGTGAALGALVGVPGYFAAVGLPLGLAVAVLASGNALAQPSAALVAPDRLATKRRR
ncbi:MAG: hypothetical protein ACE5EL_06730 [Anaerolineae bacterium]